MQLGRYRLLRKLAVGGMAEVYLAQATGADAVARPIVLKRMLPRFTGEDAFVQMFLDEAELAASLHHPNLCQVFDIGSQVGNHFFTMEYAHGRDARHLLKRLHRARHLPLDALLTIAIGACQGLHYAHTRRDQRGMPLGIVHRDISPSNLVLTYDGFVKIVDFGVAKLGDRDRHARLGPLKGKLAYMSPEQFHGLEVDHRSDLYSLGVVMWELASGRRLFRGTSEQDIAEQITIVGVPSATVGRPDCPAKLDRIIARCVDLDRDQRYESALDLQCDLETFARDARLTASPRSLARVMTDLFPEGTGEPQPPSRPRQLARGTDSPKRVPTEPSSPSTASFDDLRERAPTTAISDEITATGVGLHVKPSTAVANIPQIAVETASTVPASAMVQAPATEARSVPNWALHPLVLVLVGAAISIALGLYGQRLF